MDNAWPAADDVGKRIKIRLMGMVPLIRSPRMIKPDWLCVPCGVVVPEFEVICDTCKDH